MQQHLWTEIVNGPKVARTGFEWFQLYGTIESQPITKTGTNLPANGNAPLLSTGSVHVPSRRQAVDPKLLQGEIMFLS